MSVGIDPVELIDRLIGPNGKTPHGAGTTEDAGKELVEARAAVAGLAQAEDGSAAIGIALANPETIAALVLVSSKDSASYESVLMALRKTARARDVQGLERTVRDVKRQQQKTRSVTRIDNGSVLSRVRSSLEDAPVPEDAVVPLGWRLGPFAVARERTTTDESGAASNSLEVIAPAPVVIAGRLTSVDDGTEAMRIAWKREGRWKHATVKRDVAANAREIVKVSGLGLPVTSGTAGDLVRYLSAFEAANLSELPRARVSHQLGWQGEQGKDGFLWGNTLIKPDGSEPVAIDLDAVQPDEWRDDWIAFRGHDDGNEQIAEGYTAAGSFEAWRETVASVAEHPAAMAALYASLAAPLLEILGCPNFVVDWSHMTSTGKTTVLRLAASVWGAPDERASASAIHTWDATRAWLTDAASTLHSIPLILDDTKRARKPDVVAQTIYDLVSGRGRGRGSPLGTRRMATWRTILLSSGEQRITDFSQDGGTRPRVLEFWGLPFGGTGRETREVVQRLRMSLLQHYGHAGPLFVRYVFAHRADWSVWIDQFRKIHSKLAARDEDNPFAGRIAEPMALLTLTGALAHAALALPWQFREVLAESWDGLIAETSEADRAKVAIDHAVSWAQGHQDQFYPRSGEDMPTAGWAGYWDTEPWRWIGFLPDRLDAILVAGGFDAESTKRLWFDRGWLVTDEGRRRHRIRLKGELVYVVALSRDACDGAGDSP